MLPLPSGVSKQSITFSHLQPNLAMSSCGGSPVHLPHKIEKNVYFFWKNLGIHDKESKIFLEIFLL
jgi:hypothetical protein